LKIFSKIFAESKIVATFATAFEKNKALEGCEVKNARFLKKSCKKVWKLKKLAVPLQSVRVIKTTNESRWFFDLLVIF